MKVIQTLQLHAVRRLWLAQVLAGVGDEFYALAVVCLATTSLGYQAGYLLALQSLITLLSTLTSNLLTQGKDCRILMMISDGCRVLVMAGLAIGLLQGGESAPPLFLLVLAMTVMAYIRPVFDPSLQMALPRLSGDSTQLSSINALFDIMRRLARVLGPGLGALLFPLLHLSLFFLLTGLTYLVSLCTLGLLRKALAPVAAVSVPADTASCPLSGCLATALRGFILLRRDPRYYFHLLAFGICSGWWYLALFVSTALLLKQPDYLHSGITLGSVIAVYGVGNVLANLLVAEMRIIRPWQWMSAGRLVMATGFLCMAMGQDHYSLYLGAFVAAVGAPVTQLPMANHLQSRYRGDDVAAIFRVRLFFEWGGSLLAMLASPWLLQQWQPSGVIQAAGISYAIVGVLGWCVIHDLPAGRRTAWVSYES
ncbi:hypothetical protein QCD60_07490 [Pokkaliibacter sp. MBI-7]|uniref:hypothetical protein n=1 Tax=Pokkaliibacter sp. MBI-7 TaxID=3040600 RepID=UPI00244CAC6C|nr:hypothetical protein [Pokkaliibacter sp. MBI-7]MDH2432404.1 hypothetical protein [Pokkaliibacter sp. MBI-7]